MASFRLKISSLLNAFLRRSKFRGKDRLLRAVCPSSEIATVDLFGYKVELDLSEHIQCQVFLHGYDTDAEAFIRANLKEGGTFLDIGANVGFYSLLASSIVGPNGRVFAFEPSPRVFRKLQKTILANGIQNITALNIGLADKPGTMDLHTDPASHNETATMVPFHNATTQIVSVPVERLDSIAAQYCIGDVDYLKIDVDGFEPNALIGAGILFDERRIKALQSEFCDHWLRVNGSSPLALHRWILQQGFKDINGTPTLPDGCMIDRFFILS